MESSSLQHCCRTLIRTLRILVAEPGWLESQSVNAQVASCAEGLAVQSELDAIQSVNCLLRTFLRPWGEFVLDILWLLFTANQCKSDVFGGVPVAQMLYPCPGGAMLTRSKRICKHTHGSVAWQILTGLGAW